MSVNSRLWPDRVMRSRRGSAKRAQAAFSISVSGGQAEFQKHGTYIPKGTISNEDLTHHSGPCKPWIILCKKKKKWSHQIFLNRWFWLAGWHMLSEALIWRKLIIRIPTYQWSFRFFSTLPSQLQLLSAHLFSSFSIPLLPIIFLN